MAVKLSVVILALTTNEDLYKITTQCIASLLESEPNIAPEIIIVESNKNYLSTEFRFDNSVHVIIPESDFNFHRFLNIGINAATGDYIALCNNDLIFHPNWFSEILEVASKNPSIKSFSPHDTDVPLLRNKEFEIGFTVQHHIKGWCFVVKREIIKKRNFLDESFSFYYADNDYAMWLRNNNIKHALVSKSRVDHLEKKSSENVLRKPQNSDYLLKYEIPEYMYSGHYDHIFETEKGIAGFLEFYGKWGHPKWVYRKNKISDLLFKLNLGYLSSLLYHPRRHVNVFKKEILKK